MVPILKFKHQLSCVTIPQQYTEHTNSVQVHPLPQVDCYTCLASRVTNERNCKLGIGRDDNIMADIVSQAFKAGKYSNASKNLITYFNFYFPLPQNASWTESPLSPRLTQQVMSSLHGKPLTMESLLRLTEMKKNIGKPGFIMLKAGTSIPSFNPALQSMSLLLPWLLLHRFGQASLEKDFKSKFQLSLRP